MPALVPVNHSVADAHAAAGLSVDNLPNAPQAADLTNIEQENYELDLPTSASLGFPVLTISSAYKKNVLLHGTSRWLDVTQGDHTYRFGVSVRVIVNVSTITGESTLNLPVIAAKVELNQAFASAQLLVRGYKGAAIAKELPSWDSFNGQSFADYKKAVSALEETVFSDIDNIVPELLATTVNSTTEPVLPTAVASVGSVIALNAISRGFDLAHTVENLHDKDGALVDAVRAVYVARIGPDLIALPSADQKQAATADLHGLDLAPDLLARLKLHL